MTLAWQYQTPHSEPYHAAPSADSSILCEPLSFPPRSGLGRSICAVLVPSETGCHPVHLMIYHLASVVYSVAFGLKMKYEYLTRPEPWGDTGSFCWSYRILSLSRGDSLCLTNLPAKKPGSMTLQFLRIISRGNVAPLFWAAKVRESRGSGGEAEATGS